MTYDDGRDLDAAARAAAAVDVVIVFVEQWTAEGHDVPDLGLPDDQDVLVEAIARVNPRTVVVVESGGPVLMPWLADVDAVIEAWYPGSRGGDAMAAVLTGVVCPSGRLPVTFPRAIDQLPRPQLHDPGTTTSNPGSARTGPFSESYDIEGADVGYRWYEREAHDPLFPFGFGLSYTSFAYADLSVMCGPGPAGPAVSVSFTVTNTGNRSGIDTPQAYVRPPADGRPATARLAGLTRVALEPGEARPVDIALEPRTFARYDVTLPGWRWVPGAYAVSVGTDARSTVLQDTGTLAEMTASP